MSRSGNFIRYETRLAIYMRDGWVCVYCDRRYPAVPLSLDHVDRGEGHAASNLVTACVSCNSSRRAESVGAYTQRIGLHRGTVWRRIRTRTARPIEPYRHCVRQILERGLPPWFPRWEGEADR